MDFTPGYLENSLYYLPWKTKFIEKFCPQYAQFIRYIKTDDSDLKYVVNQFYVLFKLLLKIMEKYLKSLNDTNTTLYTDVIYEAEKYHLITDKQILYEILIFLDCCNIDNNYYKNFKNEYLQPLNDFSRKFKNLASTSGFRDKNYVIYDNSSCLWGLEKKYYQKLINFFVQNEKLKIVRIFGSRVTQDFKKFSDIDLICEGTYSLQEFDLFCGKIFKLDLPYIIDIYDIHRQSRPFIYRNVVRANIFYNRSMYIKDDYVSILQ